ncbi:MAG TPA: ChaB family protein, partial [Phycisphaerae bacterium]|nr:ChaB family protein [Phycisphaerae bacterium]
MPYANVDALPDAVKSALPPHGQAIWMAAFNSAMAEHKDEAKAAATAWAAVKTRYEQDAKGNWHPKASSESGRPLIHRSRFSEANATPNLTMLENGDFRIDIIRHGFNDDRTTYYPERVLQAAVAAGMYENAKMYFNHAGKQDFERGYRDVRAWGATILPGTVTFENGAVKGVAHAHHTDLLQILNDPVARAQVGISHEADGAYKFKEIDKKRAQ